ncbi:MAG: chemotaxis protein CheX [Deltaproteobacteria bacterium]|jgi:CheY-specific phosphatase CheX
MSDNNPFIERESVIEVTQAVCECLLGDFAEPRPPLAAAPETEPGVVACVSISGAWSGDVRVRLSPALARRLAREILQIEAASTDDAGVRDVAGEVANMIGGNLKALLPEPCRLSLPRVVVDSGPGEGALVQAFAVGADTFEVCVEAAA